MSKVSGKSEQGKRSKQVRCDAGCGKLFPLGKMEVEQLGDGVCGGGVEKVFFVCPHCGKEYVCFYADAEIRGLQEQISQSDRAVANMTGHTAEVYLRAASKRHKELRKQIDRKMAALRTRVEGEKNGKN